MTRIGFFTRLLDDTSPAERYRIATEQIVHAERHGFGGGFLWEELIARACGEGGIGDRQIDPRRQQNRLGRLGLGRQGYRRGHSAAGGIAADDRRLPVIGNQRVIDGKRIGQAPITLGSHNVTTGKAMIMARWKKSAIRNGTIPRKIWPSGMSLPIDWMT